MQQRRLDRQHLRPDNGLLNDRLLPWPGLNAPFEGAWCLVVPGTASTEHAHHEHELFIAISGAATLRSDGRTTDFTAGDVVYFGPGQSHQVVNDSDRDFEMYSLWWDGQIANRFRADEQDADTP